MVKTLIAIVVATVIVAGPDAVQAEKMGFFGAAKESTLGDVYADPERWEPLSLGSLFTEGWDEPWVSPPTGEGGAPRHGWLAAADGVFFRLSFATFGFARDFNGNGNRYTFGTTTYAPLSRRLQLQLDVPFVVSDRDASRDRNTNFGDLQITPRFLLFENRAQTHSFNLFMRTPTGSSENGNNLASVAPTYQFWTNWWRGLVVRGSIAMSIPYANVYDAGARTSFVANLAPGYYLTSHDLTPLGDLVGYLSMTLNQPTDNRADSDPTSFTLTPGLRTHLGRNWFLMAACEVPMTHPKSFSYQWLTSLMWVY